MRVVSLAACPAGTDLSSDGGGAASKWLLDLASELSSEIATASVQVTNVKDVEGSAAVRSSRGVTKHMYDLAF